MVSVCSHSVGEFGGGGAKATVERNGGAPESVGMRLEIERVRVGMRRGRAGVGWKVRVMVVDVWVMVAIEEGG